MLSSSDPAAARSTATAGRARAVPAATRPAAGDSSLRPATSRDHATASRRRSSAPASISFASTSSSPTTKATPVADLKQSDFEVTEDGKPQKIETFKLVKLDGGITDSIKEAPREIRTDYDEEMEAARDDVRLFAIFLDDYHVRRGASLAVRNPLSDLHREQPRAVGHDRRHVSARVDRVGPDDAQPLGGDAGAAAVQGAQVRLRAAGTSTSRPTRTTRRRSSRRSATRCRCRRSRR